MTKFDCVKMKNDIQQKIQKRIKGMTPKEELEFYKKETQKDTPLSKFLRDVKELPILR